MATMIDDPHFRNFASSLEAAIERCGETENQDFLSRQKQQVDTLVALEKEFKEALIASAHGERMYAAFVKFICDSRRNILDARPYFRERQGTFTQQISKALRRRSATSLYRFRFNFRFVQFVMNARAWKPRSMVKRLANQIRAIRDELITMNMPLAISRARIFYSRTPKAHLAYMDLIQIACEGLMSGVDKFVPPFSKAFRAVAIGRMTGNFIEQYSETAIHFYPPDKRKIYRANKLLGRSVDVGDFEELAQRVNTNQEGGQVEPLHRTNASEIANLVAAASTVSADTPIGERGDHDEDEVVVANRFAAPVDCQPDVIYERTEKMRNLVDATATLTPFEQKVLRLKGVSF